MSSEQQPQAQAQAQAQAQSHIVPIMESMTRAEAVMDTVTSPRSAAGKLASTTTPERSSPTLVRGQSVKLSVPLDSRSSVTTTHKLLRRDSLERREALLKGKEGSRQRRRWENDRLLSNPHAEPPLPSDYLITPTHPIRRIPYYLAPLWDAAEFQRAVESKLKGRRNTKSSRHRKRLASGVGISPFEEAATSIPKEVRSRLKHARSAKGLLMDLEEDVRGFLVKWNERERRLREEGLADAPVPSDPNATRDLPIRSKKGHKKVDSEFSDVAILTDTEHEDGDEEDEEIVFVGRAGAITSDSPSRKAVEEQENLLSEKLVFEGLEEDKGAAFGRWLAHCIGSYYGLRTWSVTTDTPRDEGIGRAAEEVGGQRVRQAYVGVDSRVRGWMGSGWEHGREFELPRPLWGMV